MSKSTSIITLGILVVLLPFISIFRSWKDIVTFILGAFIIWTGNKMRRQEAAFGPENISAPSDTHGENAKE